MPDYSTLIPLAAPLVTLIGSIAALAGVWLTQKHNRKTKLLELDQQRKLKDKELRAQERLKALELQEENHRTLRAEKRKAYKDVLRDSRRLVHYWHDAGHNYWHPGSGPINRALDPDELVQSAQELRHYHELKNWQAEVDSLASDVVVELIGTLADFIRNCEQRVLYEVSNEGVTDPKRQGPLWRGVQTTLQQEFREQGVQAAYFTLRDQIRNELNTT